MLSFSGGGGGGRGGGEPRLIGSEDFDARLDRSVSLETARASFFCSSIVGKIRYEQFARVYIYINTYNVRSAIAAIVIASRREVVVSRFSKQ